MVGAPATDPNTESGTAVSRPPINGIPVPNLNAMARNTGISVTYLSRIFNGHRRPSMKMSNKIATHMGISLDDLYGMLNAIPVKPMQRARPKAQTRSQAQSQSRPNSNSNSNSKKR